MQVNVTILNRRHGGLPTGTVCEAGEAIGRVFPHDRKTGHAGANAGYWTACPALPTVRLGQGPSLGTRFTSKRQAVEAVRDFNARYPACAMGHRDFMPSVGYFLHTLNYVKAWKRSRKARYGF